MENTLLPMMGWSDFTRPTPNADWTKHWHANGTALLTNTAFIKKERESSFDFLLAESGHPNALDSRMRLQLLPLFPQWHPVVNHIDRWREKWYDVDLKKATRRDRARETECVLTLGTPAESKWISYHSIDPDTVTTILYLGPPTSCSQSLHLFLPHCQIQMRPIPFPLLLWLTWCSRV